MATKTSPVPDALAAARKAYEAATEATAAAGAALGPADDKLAAAKKALAEAHDEALRAITEKSADPAAAKERLVRARQAVKDCEDDLDFSLLQLHAFQVADERAHEAEQVARRAFITEQIRVASREYRDPGARENVLLRLLKDTVAELIPLIAEREELHRRLSAELSSFSPEEKAQLAPEDRTLNGGADGYRLPVLRIPGQPDVALESGGLAEAVVAGIHAATAAQAERARAQRVG